MILLFYAVNELLSVETKIYECYAFAVIFLRNTDRPSGKLLRKLNIIVMGIKINILFDKMLTAFLLISKF